MGEDDLDLDSAPIGVLVRHLRERTGMSQRELALASGVSDGMIGNVERGTRNLGHATVDAVAKALRLSRRERAALVTARDRYAAEASGQAGEGFDITARVEAVEDAMRILSQQMDEVLRRLPRADDAS